MPLRLKPFDKLILPTLYKMCRGDNNLSVPALANSLVIIEIYMNECTGSLKYIEKLAINLCNI